jgi:hypothetical protein
VGTGWARDHRVVEQHADVGVAGIGRRGSPQPWRRCATWWLMVTVACLVLAFAPAAGSGAGGADMSGDVAASGGGAGEPDAVTGPAGTGEGVDPRPPQTLPPPLPDKAGDILPDPNSGVEPAHAGDRGGWLQTLVLLGVLGGVGLVATFAWRDARRKKPRSTEPTPNR